MHVCDPCFLLSPCSVGRTGRAGDKEGKAYSLLLPGDARFAGLLAQSLAVAGQEVPQALHELAMKVRA